MKYFVISLLMLATCMGQDVRRWSATTGTVALVAAGTSATVQQPATGSVPVQLENAIVYCSVACQVTQSRDGTAATTTAGTVRALAPIPANAPPPFNFFTASNVGAGNQQGGIIYVPAGGTVNICLSSTGPGCDTTAPSAPTTLVSGGTGTNYTITISSITGNADITFFARTANQ